MIRRSRVSGRFPLRGGPRHLLRAAAVATAVAAGVFGPRAVEGAARVARAANAPVPTDTARARRRTADTTTIYGDSLTEPAVVRAVNGVLTATLRVDTATLPVQRSADSTVSLNLRAFHLTATTDPGFRPNDPRFAPHYPGPTFRVRRGDLVRIRLINALPPSGPNDACNQPVLGTNIPDVFQDCFHGPDFTNIHYHGMHVTPDSTSSNVGDDVLMVIAPGDTLQYSFRIPQNQSPGTHWYHPHKHGSVAIQVANGMAGGFIVEDPSTGLDSIVRTLRMREHLIAIQQVAETVGLLSQPGVLDKPQPLVNGQYKPTIYMAPGEVQRWRIVNENTTRTTKTFAVGFTDVASVQEPSLYDIARDGVQFAPGNYHPGHTQPFLHMAPGQRLDVFVQAPRTPGVHTFQITHNAGAGRATRQPTLAADRDLDAATQAPPLVLFRVVVDPALSGRNTTLPGSLPPLPPFLAGKLQPARDTALVVFSDSLNQSPSQFYLGSRLNPFQRFDDNSVYVPADTNGRAMPMVLQQTQTWKIVNNSQQLINHPFHIHINPFQVDSVVYPLGVNDPFHELYAQLNAAARAGSPIWLDVLPLPLPAMAFDSIGTKVDTVGVPNTAYVVITQKYDDFTGCPGGSCGPPTGYFVMHCHILGHEERGMMQVLQVVRPGQPVTPPAGHVGAGYGTPQPGTGAGRRRGSGQGQGQGQRGQGQPDQHRH